MIKLKDIFTEVEVSKLEVLGELITKHS